MNGATPARLGTCRRACEAFLTNRRRIGSGSETLIFEKLEQDAALATLAALARRDLLLALAYFNLPAN